MTGGTLGATFQPDSILIAVDPRLFDMENMTARFALHPQFLAAARPKGCLSGRQTLGQCIRVHMGQHQHFAGHAIRADG